MEKLEKDNSVLLVVDMQDKLCDLMDEEMLDTVIQNTSILVKSFNIMNIPVIETKQYPKVYGNTVDDIVDILNPVLTIEKTTFSAGNNDKILEILKNKNIKNIIIVGMEAHISVLQTAIDFLNNSFNVYVIADAVISKNDFSWETALDFMQKLNANISVTEAIVYQLLKDSKSKEFNEIHKLFK